MVLSPRIWPKKKCIANQRGSGGFSSEIFQGWRVCVGVATDAAPMCFSFAALYRFFEIDERNRIYKRPVDSQFRRS
jgi:hypothetical protein